MRFLVDENFEATIADALSAVYLGHEFVSAYVNPERYCGTDDVILFPMAADDGFAAIITQDRNQLSNFAERETLRLTGLHWIGQTQTKMEGLTGLAVRSGSLVAGLAFVLADWREASHVYRLKRVEAQASQRITVTLT